MTKVSCTSKQSNCLKNGPYRDFSLCTWQCPRGGTEQEQLEVPAKGTSSQQRELRDCCLLPFGSEAVLEGGQRAQGVQQQHRAAAHPLQGGCLWVVGWHPCSLRPLLPALEGWDRAEVQFCLTEHEGAHASSLPLHPCFGAFVPQTKCLLRCFLLQLLSSTENGLPG